MDQGQGLQLTAAEVEAMIKGGLPSAAGFRVEEVRPGLEVSLFTGPEPTFVAPASADLTLSRTLDTS